MTISVQLRTDLDSGCDHGAGGVERKLIEFVQESNFGQNQPEGKTCHAIEHDIEIISVTVHALIIRNKTRMAIGQHNLRKNLCLHERSLTWAHFRTGLSLLWFFQIY